MAIAAEYAGARLLQHARHDRPQALQLSLRPSHPTRGGGRRRAHALGQTADHRRGLSHDRARRGHQAPIAADESGPALLAPRLQANRDHPPADAAPPIADARHRLTQRRTAVMHRPRQRTDPVLQQRAVGGVVHIRFYDRGVNAKAAAVRDPGTLGDVHHLAVQLLDDIRAERLTRETRLREGAAGLRLTELTPAGPAPSAGPETAAAD